MNVLIITSSYDIPIAETAAEGLDSYRTFFFDPTLVDEIKRSKLRNTELIVWNDCPTSTVLDAYGHERATAFERALDAAVRPVLGDISLEGWQHFNLTYFFQQFRWYSGLWPAVLERLEGMTPHIFVCDAPPSFYWPSFIPTLLLLQYLRTLGRPFNALRYGERPDEADVVINLTDGNPEGKRYDVLTHLPTCFYDIPYFREELVASGRSVLNIEPKYWSVGQVPGDTVNLMRLGDQQRVNGPDPRLAELAALLDAHIEPLLTPYIATAGFRERYAAQLSRLYQSQYISCQLLERYFHNGRPARVLLADDDAGFHGPILSYAARHQIPVLQVPHSKVSLDRDFIHTNVTVLTHAVQGGVPVNTHRKRLPHALLAYPEQLQASTAYPAPLRKVGLLLNGLSLNGLMCTAHEPYFAGIRAIDAWCKRRGVELTIRSRPGQSMHQLLQAEIGMDVGALDASLARPLAEWAGTVDVCLMYDAPTTASLEFLKNGIPIVNPTPDSLSPAETLTCDTALVPRGDVAAILRQLDGFLDDTDNLDAFRRQQFAAYVSRQALGVPLRRFL
jgi:hypothetical protein